MLGLVLKVLEPKDKETIKAKIFMQSPYKQNPYLE